MGRERGELVAYLWDDFLRESGDHKFSAGLGEVDGTQMFPRPEWYLPDRYMEHRNFMNYPGLVEIARNRNGKSIWDIDGIKEALPALEAQRKRDLENWMDKERIDFVVFPANGDVGRTDMDHSEESTKHALKNGVRYSNGNRALRHMGVPTMSVPMGIMGKSKMPVNLTFAGKHGQDAELLKYAYAFEKQTKHRVQPSRTPVLASDRFEPVNNRRSEGTQAASSPKLAQISVEKHGENRVRLRGSIETQSPMDVKIEVFVDGKAVLESSIEQSEGQWSVDTEYTPFEPPKPIYGGVGLVVGNINIVVMARSKGHVDGKLVMIPAKAPA